MTVESIPTFIHNIPTQPNKTQVVKTPRSVYTPLPGKEAFRPDQRTPVGNFYLAVGTQDCMYVCMCECVGG